jgi:hypothetical protein
MNQEKIDQIIKETKGNLSKAFNGTNTLKDFHLGRVDEVGKSLSFSLIHQAMELQEQIESTAISLLKLMELEISSCFLEVIVRDTIPRIELASKLCENLVSKFSSENNLNTDFKKINNNDFLRKKLETLSDLHIDQSGKLIALSLNGLKSHLETIIKSKIVSSRTRWIILLSLQSNFYTQEEKNSNWTNRMIQEINKLLTNKEMINSALLLDSETLLNRHQSIDLFRDEKAGLSLFVMNAYSKALLGNDSKASACKNSFPDCTKALMERTKENLKNLFGFESYFLSITTEEIKQIVKASFSDDPDYKYKFPSPTKA